MDYIFQNYFVNGDDAFLDTNLDWYKAETMGGNSLPSEYCAFDSSGALHCVVRESMVLKHQLSWDGGESWLIKRTIFLKWLQILKNGISFKWRT